MGSTRLHQFNVYLDDGLANKTRLGAAAFGGNASAYLRSILEREFGSGSLASQINRDLHYLKISADAVMDEVQLLRLPPDKMPYRQPNEDTLRSVVRRVHQTRMGTLDAD